MISGGIASVSHPRWALPSIWYGRATSPSERAEVEHLAICVKEGVLRSICSLGNACNLAGCINAVTRTRGSAKRTQIESLVDHLGFTGSGEEKNKPCTQA